MTLLYQHNSLGYSVYRRNHESDNIQYDIPSDSRNHGKCCE
nr:MAG TPA: hypothetical protein [Caudoviricetes sp.]